MGEGWWLERERERMVVGKGSEKGWHMRRQPSLDGSNARSFCLYARANVASRAVEGLNVREKCQFSRGARRVLLRRTWIAGNRRSPSLIGVGLMVLELVS